MESASAGLRRQTRRNDCHRRKTTHRGTEPPSRPKNSSVTSVSRCVRVGVHCAMNEPLSLLGGAALPKFSVR
jgi:hypothetical protein